MGISDKMGQLVSSMQVGAKTASTSFLLLTIKIITAFVVGLTLSMVGQELVSYGTISLIFVLLVSTASLLKIMSSWAMGTVLIFDLICVLVALLLRMYIIIAPN